MKENFNAKYAHEYVDKLLKELEQAQEKISSLTLSISGGATLLPIKPYKMVETFYQRSYDPAHWSEERVEEIYQQDLLTIDENEKAVANNMAVYEALYATFKNLGFSDSELRFASSRARRKTSETAGWLESIRRIQTSSGAKRVHEIKTSVLERIAEAKRKAEQERQQRQYANERETKRQELLKYIGTLEVKYGRTFGSVYEAIQFIISKDKYLYLAYYLEKNRGDWSEGPDYARIGLEGFSAETEVDHQIKAELWPLVSDWDGDGRVFRDCKWNYSTLYGMADQELLAELSKLKEGELAQ